MGQGRTQLADFVITTRSVWEMADDVEAAATQVVQEQEQEGEGGGAGEEENSDAHGRERGCVQIRARPAIRTRNGHLGGCPSLAL